MFSTLVWGGPWDLFLCGFHKYLGRKCMWLNREGVLRRAQVDSWIEELWFVAEV